jgi:hypothetical protein
MSLQTDFYAEAVCEKPLSLLFLAHLGDERMETTHLRLIERAVHMRMPHLAQEAEAWLHFSRDTREFDRRMASIAEDRRAARTR